MGLSKRRKRWRRLGRLFLITATLVCTVFALISTHQLNDSIDRGNRRIVLNYGNQVAARLHDLFERVDVSLMDLSKTIEGPEGADPELVRSHLLQYETTWDMDACGLMYEDGANCLADGSPVVFENEISLRDVLSYSDLLNISRQTIGGRDLLVFAKPCNRTLDGRTVTGLFTAMEVAELEQLLGDYGYSSDSFLVLAQADGTILWKQENVYPGDSANCFQELAGFDVAQGDSILQMQTRMTVAMDGTLSYTRDGQDFYLAYVPLNVNYWYLLVSARSDTIDLTELARQHFFISAMLVIVILVMGAASIIYLTQRNRSISRYNDQLKVAAELADEAAQANEANRAKQEFLAKVTHDIRTPLNGVTGMITLAKDAYADREQCLAYLDKATASAGYLLGLLNDVLDMSRIESGKQTLARETVDLRQLLGEVKTIAETTAGAKGLSFYMDDSALTHRYFTGDQLRLKQILMNLCSNAIKYTHPGGRVDLEAGETAEGLVFFRVSDNGEGIAPDKLDSIFKPFEQVSAHRQGGVGLGLSIVRSFVELMDGHIAVESREGAGSTFIVTLPLPLTDAPERPCVPQVPVTDLTGISILLAEDNDINAEIAITLLERQGATVTHTRDGAEAVEEFMRQPIGRYQVILMDIQMPRMDGLEATREIRGSDRPDGADIPILAMTANAFHEQRDEMRAAGMNDYLYKPIDIDVVCTTIRTWVREGRA